MINEINTKEAKIRIDNGAIVLDVRTGDEHKDGHIEGSNNIDIFDEAFSEQLENLDKSKSYIVCCASGNRSAKATQIMTDMGFGDVQNLVGGMSEWEREEMPIV